MKISVSLLKSSEETLVNKMDSVEERTSVLLNKAQELVHCVIESNKSNTNKQENTS